MAENTPSRIEVSVPIPYLLQPFRRDRLNHQPLFFSSGQKTRMAEQARVPHFTTPMLAERMGEAEDAFHLRHGTKVIGPTEVEGVPYPVLTANAKGEAAKIVMNSMPKISYGAGVVTDAVFMLNDPLDNISITLNKPKTKQEIDTVMQLLVAAGERGNVGIFSLSGICRFEFGGFDPFPSELYMIRVNLGIIKCKLDPAALLNGISTNSGKTAGGLTVPFVYEQLVKPRKEVSIDVLNYGNVPKLQSMAFPFDGKTISIPGYNIDALHLAGVGFVN